jgi:hypothetical protein
MTVKGDLLPRFSSGGKQDRDDIEKLIPTLACQITERIPIAKEGMQRVLSAESMVPYLELESQLAKLIIEPISNFKVHQFLVIIDGLDECSSRDGISNLIRLLRR